MLIDSTLEFCNAQSAVGTAASAVNSTKSVDLGIARNIAPGEDLWLVIQIQEAILAAGGAANVTFKLLEDTQADMASGGAITLWTSGAIAKATLVAGYVACKIKVPSTSKRYLRVTFTPDTNDTTDGNIDAFLVKDADAQTYHASGFSVS